MRGINIIDKLRDPELLAQMGLGEKLAASLIVMVLGLASCLIILCIIMWIVRLMQLLSRRKAAPAPAAAVPAPVPAAPAEDEKALIAAITAAIALEEGEGRFYIRNIRPVSTGESWSAAGIREAAARRAPWEGK